jgi:FixJ family two-component response regulator
MDKRSQQSSNAAEHAHRICIVDDDAGVRDSLRALLESYGFEIREFDSAAALLGAPIRYCYLIVDYRMPVTNGLDLLELLRMGGIDTPAILMTDKDEPALASRIGAAKAVRALTKPISEAILIRSIAAACDGGICTAHEYADARTRSHEFSGPVG